MLMALRLAAHRFAAGDPSPSRQSLLRRALFTEARAVATLVDLARCRHGDAAALRALARTERDAVAALRVL